MEHGTKAHLNKELIEKLRSFQIPGEPDMIAEIVEILRSTAPTKIEAIAHKLASGDLESAGREAHSLKSSALSLGAERLGSICHAIEAIPNEGMGRAEAKAKGEALMQEIHAEWTIVQGELNQLSR